MAIEYLLVTFPEPRNVLADGAGVGVTNHIMMLPGDEYQITLEGAGYAPASQDVALNGTSLIRPLVIAFTPTVADVAAAPPPAGGAAAPTAAAAGAPAPGSAKSDPRAAAPAGASGRDKKNA